MTTPTWYSVSETETPDAAENAARERVAAAWKEAPIENLEVLAMLLETARDQVIAYAPEGETGEWVDGYYVIGAPNRRYVYAQLRQAENLWNAGRVSPSGDLGDGSFTFTPRPLDKTIRQIIRPVDGKPDAY